MRNVWDRNVFYRSCGMFVYKLFCNRESRFCAIHPKRNCLYCNAVSSGNWRFCHLRKRVEVVANLCNIHFYNRTARKRCRKKGQKVLVAVDVLDIVLILLSAVAAIVWLSGLVEIASTFVDERKRERECTREYGARLKCMNCTYCRRRLYRPFRNSYTLAHYIPAYCSKFRVQLAHGSQCVARTPEGAERTGNTKHYRPSDIFGK